MATHNVNDNIILANLFSFNVVSVGDIINLLLIQPQVTNLVVDSINFSQGPSADIILLADNNNNFCTIQKDNSNVIHIFKTADSNPIILHEHHV
ncbi:MULTISPECIES: hypothetical protein [Aeromonas]|uniref:hypothetical protein n=1 Tax=Aeromonas TaxID=642 RepID=UPI0012EA25EC|nr:MULTISPECIES: hypothetical protein [Aeromonas]MCF5850188.1 hypothetical protein [Aeromonas veronii]